MKELSIFIDESGDFGDYDYHSPYYIVSMVMHDQGEDISFELNKLNAQLFQMGYSKHCIHAGPIIRQEEEYRFLNIFERRKILKHLMTFLRNISIKYTTFYIEKRKYTSTKDIFFKLSNQLKLFISEHYSFFLSYDLIKVYYDNGQVELSRLLSSTFNLLLDNVEFRKVLPINYRLFQVADLICTLKLIELKINRNKISKSELKFFGDERTIKKNYLKPLKLKEL